MYTTMMMGTSTSASIGTGNGIATADIHRSPSLVFRRPGKRSSSSSTSLPDLGINIQGLGIPEKQEPFEDYASSVPLTPCSQSILVPFVDRKEEMRSLLQHNKRFFDVVKQGVGYEHYLQLNRLWNMTRDEIGDHAWIQESRRLLGPGLFCEWSRVVGVEDREREEDVDSWESDTGDDSRRTLQGESIPEEAEW